MTIKTNICIQELKAKAAAKAIRYCGYVAKAINENGIFVVKVKANNSDIQVLKNHIDSIYKYDVLIQSI
jgi:hypothetical protein